MSLFLCFVFYVLQYVLGDYRWRTATQTEREATHFGRGLRLLGHQPKQNLVIFAETRAEWMISTHGCFKQNIPGKLFQSISIN
jgi:long-chain acyl-CoA synthetase